MPNDFRIAGKVALPYIPLALGGDVPVSVETFVRDVVDPHFADVHAMLRLPLPDAGITVGCNYAIANALLALLSGSSVTLFDPDPAKKNRRGELFKNLVSTFYPWETEPEGGIVDGARGSQLLYRAFRNPLAHNFGYERWLDEHPRRVSRLHRGRGLEEAELEAIEAATERPSAALTNAPTLWARPNIGGHRTIDLNVEALYWGTRETLRRLTGDVDRMAAASNFIQAAEA